MGAFAKSGRAADLPGCTGKLPKNAPRSELALHDIKLRLMEAEEQLAKNKLDKLDSLLADADAALAKNEPANPELPDRWEQAQRLYGQLTATLRNRRKLLQYGDRIRASYAAAMAKDKTQTDKDVEGGPASAKKAAQACLAVLAEVKGAGVDLATPIELEKKEATHRLDALQEECEHVSMSADAKLLEQERVAKAKRAQWRAALKGERRKIFDAHVTTLPKLDGETAASSASWRYTTPAGDEVYAWKGNKLLKRSVEAAR